MLVTQGMPCPSLPPPCQVALPQTSMSTGRLVEMGRLRRPACKDVTGPVRPTMAVKGEMLDFSSPVSASKHARVSSRSAHPRAHYCAPPVRQPHTNGDGVAGKAEGGRCEGQVVSLVGGETEGGMGCRGQDEDEGGRRSGWGGGARRWVLAARQRPPLGKQPHLRPALATCQVCAGDVDPVLVPGPAPGNVLKPVTQVTAASAHEDEEDIEEVDLANLAAIRAKVNTAEPGDPLPVWKTSHTLKDIK
ncbi:hypothetical protein OG21DRAFT_1526343 [Imleria badia]|nr:hypothetical protein OG21DRAFT_1526343 [Imleria badia]